MYLNYLTKLFDCYKKYDGEDTRITFNSSDKEIKDVGAVYYSKLANVMILAELPEDLSIEERNKIVIDKCTYFNTMYKVLDFELILDPDGIRQL